MLLEIFSACYVVFRCKLRKITKTEIMLLLLIIFLVSMLKGMGTGLNTIPIIVLSFILIYILFEDKVLNLFKVWFVSVLAAALLETLPFYLVQIMGVREPYTGIFSSIIVILLLWLYYFFIGRRLPKEMFDFSIKIWILIIIVLILLVLMQSFFNYCLVFSDNKKVQKIFIILIGSGVIAIILLVATLVYYLNSTYKYQMRSEIVEKFNKQQKEYYTHLLEKENETRNFRHDIRDQLLEIRSLCNNGKVEEASSYVNVLLNNALDIGNNQYDVGNIVINTMLNYYLYAIKNECYIYINGLVSDDIDIENVDLCIIVSNLIKNAVEAVMKLESGNKEIYFTAKQINGYFGIIVKNTADIKKIIKNGSKIVTNKSDKNNHGVGLENVKRTVQKYAGTCDIKTENGYFIVEICIKI